MHEGPLRRLREVADHLDQLAHDPATIPGLPGAVILAASAIRHAVDDLERVPFDQEEVTR